MDYLSILVMVFGFFIVLGFEIRHRLSAEEIAKLKDFINELNKDVLELKQQIKLKKNIYEDVR